MGARLGALLLDSILLIGVLFGLSFVMTALDITGPSASASESAVATAVFLVWWLLALIYHPACWYVFGATPGQRALGMRVTQAANGQALGIGAVLVRYMIFFVETVLFPLGIVAGILAANDPFKRAWHDEIARSIVVRRA